MAMARAVRVTRRVYLGIALAGDQPLVLFQVNTFMVQQFLKTEHGGYLDHFPYPLLNRGRLLQC